MNNLSVRALIYTDARLADELALTITTNDILDCLDRQGALVMCPCCKRPSKECEEELTKLEALIKNESLERFAYRNAVWSKSAYLNWLYSTRGR